MAQVKVFSKWMNLIRTTRLARQASLAGLSTLIFASQAFALSSHEDAFSSFRDGVYPGLRMHCAQCHSSEAIFPHGPDHSDTNVTAAFATFQRFIDYSKPAESRILQQLRNAHYCKDHGVYCGNEMQIQAELEPKILNWIARNAPQAPPDPNAADDFMVPDRDSFDAYFPLKTSDGVLARDLVLHLNFIRFQGKAFTLRQIEAEATAGTVRISGLGLLINGQAPTLRSELEFIDNIGSFDAWPDVAGRKISLVLSNSKPLFTLNAGDRISIKYRIDRAAATPCQAQRAFELIIAPMLRAGAFGEANWVGLTNQEIAATLATDRKPLLLKSLCQAFEQRINWHQPMRSPVLANMTTAAESIFPIVKTWRKLGEVLGRPIQTIKVKDVAMARVFGYGATSSRTPATCALAVAGDLYCWGHRATGQILTLGYDRTETLAARIDLPEPVVQFTMGGNFICALTDSRQVWCWGQNSFRGTGNAHVLSIDPAFVSGVIEKPLHYTTFDGTGGARVKKLAASNASTCALTESGKVYCWGANQYGQLGAEKSGNEILPPAKGLPSPDWLPDGMPLPERMVDITGGDFHHCALSESGKFYCWGMGSYGIPGTENGSGNFSRPIGSSPQSISMIKPAMLSGPIDKGISGGYHNCALSGGRLNCFGLASLGELGHEKDTRGEVGSMPGDMANSTVKFPGEVLDVAAGSGVTCAVSKQHSLYCWGNARLAKNLNYENQSIIDTAMQAPIGTAPGSVAQSKIAWSDQVKKVAIGIGEICAINQDDELHCWGQLDEASGVDLQLFNIFKEKGIDLGFYTRVLLIR